MFPLGYLIHWDKISIHYYTDNTQLYLSIDLNNIMLLDNLYQCFIKNWMTQNVI